MSADDFRDYLNQQAQAHHATQRLADISRDPEREAADVEQAVENVARDQLAVMAESADNLDDGYVSMVTEVRDLRATIESRELSVADAKKALLELRQRHGAMKQQGNQLRSRYESATKTAKNPGARRDELIAKYGI